ncbi:outer membrane channel protein TolC [Colwellia sp. E2M01]|uniref:outer membrane channel protein TolC n=1 Tax=Colwellia sp. E2M01 TaxID=2841561 RepID=UPI001C09292C|nr:outer membrane channel protein TolC [Colwellia sp. E2M01]MBU2869671.1 outer membrane channel protein TolC [Colwellia sp. E2M01]
MKKKFSTLIIALTTVMSSTQVQADDLLTVYQQALLNDPTILISQAQYMSVKENIEQVRSTLLPQINLTGGYTIGEQDSYSALTNTITNSEYTSLTYGGNLNMQIYHHDSWLSLNNAKKAAHQSDLQYQVSKQDLITRVTQVYFNLLSSKDDLVFANAEKKAIERQLEQTKQRFSVGLTAITDVYEAQAQYDNAVTEAIRAENAILQAEEAVRLITNVYPKNVSVLNTDRFSTSKPVPSSADEWQTTAEAKNLDLITAKVGIDIAQDQISIARAGHYPTLDFAANYNAADTDSAYNNQPEINEPNVDGYYLGVNLNIPIYSGGAIQSSVRQAQNNFVIASQELSLTHREVVRTTRNAYNTVITAISAIKALEQSVLSATKSLEATEAGFEVGTRTIVDVLDSTRNLYGVKRNLSSTRYAYIQNVLLLKRAAGTITDEDITAINSGLVAANN